MASSFEMAGNVRRSASKMNQLLSRTLEKGELGERLTRDEALALGGVSNPDDLMRLGEAALKNRLARFSDEATYVCNLQINPTNICEGTCDFCCFSAKEGDEHAYVLTEKEIFSRIREFEPNEVHIVGGMTPLWDFDRSLNLIKKIHQTYPGMYVKGFTATEIDWFHRTTGLDWGDVIGQLVDAGLNGLPGGGAEVFSARMRESHCPQKLSPDHWIEIHKIAHQIGIKTNATMLYGLDETWEERIDHLLALRDLQDETSGFSCFIPLAYQPGKGAATASGPSPSDSLAMIAIARLVLDNFPHIKAYWPMIGLETAAAALSWGADDLDGTLGRERIAHAAGASSPVALARNRMEETIRLGGFVPVERKGNFEPQDKSRK